MYNQQIETFPNSDKQETKVYIWMYERGLRVNTIATPIYSENKDLAVVFVYFFTHGLESWLLEKNKNGKWTISCTKQIWIE